MSESPPLLVRVASVLGHPGADALLIRAGRIAGIGAAGDLARSAGPSARTLSVTGGLACPGFHDAHVHLGLSAERSAEVELRGKGAAAVVAAVSHAAAVATPGAAPGRWVVGRWVVGRWVVGSGLDPAATLGSGGAPADLLETAAPGCPVLLRTHDYHGVHVNRTALASLASVLRACPADHIAHDAAGRPTGVLLESAALAAEAVASDLSDEAREAGILACLDDFVAHGITAVHEMSGSRDHATLLRLDAAGRLPIDVFATVSPANVATHVATSVTATAGATGAPRLDSRGGRRLHIVALKAFLDGSLGSRSAALLEPYEGEHGANAHRGLITMSPEDAREAVRCAAERGLPAALHAIGDAAVRTALDVLAAVPPPGAAPHRVEHAQLIHDDDLPRFARHGIVASLQPVHIRVDAPLALSHWGARARGAFPLRRLLDSGAPVALGSDAPVESLDPLEGIRAAVDRCGEDGTRLAAEEAITTLESLDGYTRGAAAAVGRERDLGRVSRGAPANLTVLSRDIVGDADPAAALADCHVAATLVAGEVLYEGGVS